MTVAILSARGLKKSFGGNCAVDGVDLELNRGELVALVGPNGAGKTTCLNLVSGQIRCDSGSIHIEGHDVTRLDPSAENRKPLYRSFQNGGTFAQLSAAANVAVAGVVRGMARREAEAAALDAIERVGLGSVAAITADQLSGGQRKLIDFARLLLARPAIALLDEPTAGVNPAIVGIMRRVIVEMRQQETAFLVISHDLPWLFEFCDRVVVMAAGRVLAAGSPAEISAHPEVMEAYLA